MNNKTIWRRGGQQTLQKTHFLRIEQETRIKGRTHGGTDSLYCSEVRGEIRWIKVEEYWDISEKAASTCSCSGAGACSSPTDRPASEWTRRGSGRTCRRVLDWYYPPYWEFIHNRETKPHTTTGSIEWDCQSSAWHSWSRTGWANRCLYWLHPFPFQVYMILLPQKSRIYSKAAIASQISG